MTLGQYENTQYSPRRHFIDIAQDIVAGIADAIAASNLLSGLERGEVELADISVPLCDIEDVAGRKLHEPIMD